MAGTTFDIDIDVKSDTAVSASARLATLQAQFDGAKTEASKAAEAVALGQRAYDEAEKAASRAAVAVERIGQKADAQRGKLEAAMKAGDERAFWRAAQAIENLNQKQAEAVSQANAANTALADAATSLDNLKTAAGEAEVNQTKLMAATEAARAAAAEQALAVQAAADAIRAEDAALIASAANRAGVLMRLANEEAKAIEKADAEIAAATANRMAVLMNAANEEAKASTKAADAVTKSAPTGKVNEIAEGLGKLGGPLGMVGQRAFGMADAWNKLKSSLGGAGPYVAIAVAIVAIGTAAIAATVAVAAWSISLTDAARSQRLLADGIAQSVDGGYELQAAFDDISSRIPITTDELSSMAKKLADSGLKGRALTDQLEKTAEAAAKAKFGPDFSKQLLSLDSQAARFKKNVSNLFGDLDIEPVLQGLERLVSLFDENSASGRSLKVVFNSFFQPLIDGADGFAVKAERMFLQLQIWTMKALIAMKPYREEIGYIGDAFVAIAAMIAIAAGVLTAAFVAGLVPIVAFFAALEWLRNKSLEVGTAIREFFTGLDLSEIGTNLMKGLANGVTNAGKLVVSSVTGVVTGAISSAKQLLGIASPSKVFEEIGQFTGEGMAVGVDAETAGVQSSLEQMVAPPEVQGATTGVASATVSGGGNVYNIYVDAPGGDESAIEAAVDRVMRKLLEGTVAQLGGAVPA